MEKKQIIIYASIAVLGFGLVIGTALYLRARNAPTTDLGLALTGGKPANNAQVKPSATTNNSAKSLQGVRPFKPIESYPKLRGWQQGVDPPLKPVIWPTDKQLIQNPSSTKPTFTY